MSRHTDNEAARALKRPQEDRVKYKDVNCQELGKASLKCIENHGYDRSVAAVQCKDAFKAFRDCQKEETARKRASVPNFF